MGETVYLNGRFVPLEQAMVPIDDRGYQFADGIYEVIRVYGGRPFLMERHLDRLERSAAEIELPRPPREELEAAAAELLRRNGLSDAAIYIQITRGAIARQHLPPAGLRPQLVMTARPVPAPGPEQRRRGIAVITLPDDRWLHCNVKSVGLLPNVLGKLKASRAGCADAIYVRDGVVTESTSSNVCAVFDGELWTHPANHLILHGITRGAVLELARAAGIRVREEAFRAERLGEAEELVLTSTILEVMPITQVDGRPVGSGVPGPVARRLQEAFEAWALHGKAPASAAAD